MGLPMGVPMAIGQGAGFPQRYQVSFPLYSHAVILLGIPMGVCTAGCLERVFSLKLLAIPMGIPMKLFLWVFLWRVA